MMLSYDIFMIIKTKSPVKWLRNSKVYRVLNNERRFFFQHLAALVTAQLVIRRMDSPTTQCVT